MKTKLLNFIVFGLFALALFMPFGLLSLAIGPSRWIANYGEKVSWNASTESNFQKLIIVLLLVFSLFFAYKLFKKYENNRTFSKKIIVTLAIICIAFTSSIFILKPEYLNVNHKNLAVSQDEDTLFEFGPYPNEKKLEELKKAGYQGVITLLHPMVVPAEPILLNKEKKIAAKIHLKVISIPMLPWISENEESIKKIKVLARTAKGKYYVHCNLGRDRAGLFKKIIESENQQIVLKSNIKYNVIKTDKPFERGPVFIFPNEIFFTPYPTDEELFHYFLNSKIKTVVNIMDDNNPEDKVWIEKEKKIILQHHQEFYNFPVTASDSDSKIISIIKEIKKLPKPVVIHGFSSNHVNSKKFLKLYQSLK